MSVSPRSAALRAFAACAVSAFAILSFGILAGMLRCASTLCVLAAAVLAAAPAGQRRLSTDYTCASDLGPGVGNGSRRFCDVVITPTPAKSVAVPIPPRTGEATLLFDLHNRFTIPAAADAGAAYARHTTIVALLGKDGHVLARSGVEREFRSEQDLFDRITGGPAAGGVKQVAPGQPHAVSVAVPAGVTSVGIVGERLRVLTRNGTATYDGTSSPDRPIALVSNVRVEYTAK